VRCSRFKDGRQRPGILGCLNSRQRLAYDRKPMIMVTPKSRPLSPMFGWTRQQGTVALSCSNIWHLYQHLPTNERCPDISPVGVHVLFPSIFPVRHTLSNLGLPFFVTCPRNTSCLFKYMTIIIISVLLIISGMKGGKSEISTELEAGPFGWTICAVQATRHQ